MPVVRLEVRRGWSPQDKKALLDATHTALVEALKIPEDDRTQRIVEHASEDFELPPDKSERFVLVEVTPFAGRSLAAKRRLYRALVSNIGALGVAPPVSRSCFTRWQRTTGVSGAVTRPARWISDSRSRSERSVHRPP